MKSEIRIENSAELCRIEIEGTIGVPEAWQFDESETRVATYEKFRGALQRIASIDAPEVVVDIRSTGGDVNDALLIHDALSGLQARITTRCFGYTASAATIIAQAASAGRREISANALYLIHGATCAAEGNAAELTGTLDMLRRTDERIAAVYAARAGRPAAEFAALMAENNGGGRWLSPAEAVAAGLADMIVEAAPDTVATAVPPLPGKGWEYGSASGAFPAARCETIVAAYRQRRGFARNFFRSWERLFDRMRQLAGGTGLPAVGGAVTGTRGVSPAETPVAVGVLPGPAGTDMQPLLHRAAAEAARDRALPSATRLCEDPSPDGNSLTPNQRAYAEDARRFRQP